MHCRSSLITSVPPNPQHAPAAPPTNPAAILPNEQCTNRLSVEPRYYTFPHRVTSHIDRATSKLKVNRQVHTGSLILARIYWRRGVGLIAPSTDIPFKVGPSDVDHLVAGEVPAYAAICTLALPKGFILPFCILLRFTAGTAQESGPEYRVLSSLSKFNSSSILSSPSLFTHHSVSSILISLYSQCSEIVKLGRQGQKASRMTTHHAGHGSRGFTGVIIAVVSTAIAFVVLVLRLLTRSLIVRNVGAEDYVVLVAFALSVALTALIWVEMEHGQGMASQPTYPESGFA
jgi:hypothetical protein